MNLQGSLFAPTGTDGRERPVDIRERLLARTTDPATSKVGARRVVLRKQPKGSLRRFLMALALRPMTTREAGIVTDPTRALYWHWEYDKRVKSWNIAGHIELTGEVRDGGRVWRTR
jgi:hypothetical protein